MNSQEEIKRTIEEFRQQLIEEELKKRYPDELFKIEVSVNVDMMVIAESASEAKDIIRREDVRDYLYSDDYEYDSMGEIKNIKKVPHRWVKDFPYYDSNNKNYEGQTCEDFLERKERQRKAIEKMFPKDHPDQLYLF